VSTESRRLAPSYGRLLSDFEAGATYTHPWEVTVDEGMCALFAASFQDAMPVYASRAYARTLGFRDRPVHPLVLMNLGLSFSVHDVSEQAIAHLAYMDLHFPAACYAGDTVAASSKVLGVKPSSSGDKGVVHVRTVLERVDDQTPVCVFERKALVRAGTLSGRLERGLLVPVQADVAMGAGAERLPGPLRDGNLLGDVPARGFGMFFDDFRPGNVIVHGVGHTVGESEHMQLTTLARNSHPLHFDEVYAKAQGFAGTRVVYGGLVLGWVCALSSRDTGGNALWDLGLDAGAHPAGVVAGDTLYAASKVLAVEDRGLRAGSVTLRLVGVKNVLPSELLDQGVDLFGEELHKTDPTTKVKQKVVEISRTLLVRKRP
jgi:2-methylfumaryl-CoA hydratase